MKTSALAARLRQMAGAILNASSGKSIRLWRCHCRRIVGSAWGGEIRIAFRTAAWAAIQLIGVLLVCSGPVAHAQQDPFRWMDFHAQKDQSEITWVTRSLDREKWTAIREIGVQYDAALVVTTLRPSSQSPASADRFTVWSVSLTTRAVTQLLEGVDLRWIDWMHFGDGSTPEPAALYDDCEQCNASSFFTSFHYDFSQHLWAARWMRGGQAVPVWSSNAPAGVTLTQIAATMAGPGGREIVATWNHFDYGTVKAAEDFLYQFDIDPLSALERTRRLSGKDAEAMEQKLCLTQNTALAFGQDSELCLQILKPTFERKPVTTPPANNHGRSIPPGSRRAPR